MSTYSFQDVTASLSGPGGVINLGYGAAVAEEGITITRVKKNTQTIGADGEGMNSLHAAKNGTMTFRLLQTSPENQQLMAMYDFQSLSATVWGQNVIVVEQKASGDITTGRGCAFSKAADLPYKTVGGIMEWAFDVIKIDGILGAY